MSLAALALAFTCAQSFAEESAVRPSVKVAALKVIPVAYDKDGNYRRFEQFAREAAAAGAQVIVTSECYLDGYLGNIKMRPELTFEKLLTFTEPVDGPYVRKAAALAKELGVHILFCFSERRGEKAFNTAALFSPGGALLGTYSKSHTGGEFYSPGSDFPVWETSVGRIGVLICFDRQMPETARMLAMQGAEMILIPAHSPVVERINEDVMMRVRAYENNAFVVLVNPFNTLIANPDGEIIAHNPVRDEQGVILAELDLGARDPERAALTRRRPEIYGGLVQQKP
jgi:predicted amidohydrolase